MKRTFFVAIALMVIFTSMLANSPAVASKGGSDVVAVDIQSSSITWTPLATNLKGLTLTISGPNGFYSRQQFGADARPTLSSEGLEEGVYLYEIVLAPNVQQDPATDPALRGLGVSSSSEMRQSGAFTVLAGTFVMKTKEPAQKNPSQSVPQEGDRPLFDVVTPDDGIITGSLCVGFDCLTDGTENFGFDTIRMKENNTRLKFDDTSISAGFPANDWTIVANDSASGGANYLAFEDTTGAKTPFKVMAGARTDALFVSSNGDIGIGTSVPAKDVHILSGDTPAIRLDQDGSMGWTPQIWDVAGNESNFFVRDNTSGGSLPFRIRPGAPTSSIDIASNGYVGIGTASPSYRLDVTATGTQALMAVRRTDGAILTIGAGLSTGNIATVNNYPLIFRVNNILRMTLGTDGALTVQGPVNATAFNPTSDRNAKENFAMVDQGSVLKRVSALPISTWNFIEGDNKVKHMGPMAQDFYAAFGLGMDDKHISTVDADGVALAAIQELDKQNQALSAENASLRSKVENLNARVTALESGFAPAKQISPAVAIGLLVVNLCLIVLVVRGLSSKARAVRP